MWCAVVVCLLLPVSQAFEEIGMTKDEGSLEKKANNLTEQQNVENFLEDMWDVTTALVGIGRSYERTAASSSIDESLDEGRRLKLKQKRAQLQFFMKTFLTMKFILGLLLPLGIIASKVLAWKAVTLSLIALILAKISFFKNFLGHSTLSAQSPQFVPPVFIHSLQNDPFWKRQADVQSSYA